MNSKQVYVKCSIPNCAGKCGYHHVKSNKRGGGVRTLWKSVCAKHRTGIGKNLVDRWKLMRGCENSDGRYGIACTCVISDPGQLQINHKDGNNLNREDTNIEVLCGNCHTIATKVNKHYLPKISDQNTKMAKPKLFKGL